MASIKESSFNEEYEAFVAAIYEDLRKYSPSDMKITSDLEQKLKSKREFGITKYGEKSFQASRENALSVDTIQHGLEELLDYMNYTLHEIYKAAARGKIAAIIDAQKRFNSAVDLYIKTKASEEL